MAVTIDGVSVSYSVVGDLLSLQWPAVNVETGPAVYFDEMVYIWHDTQGTPALVEIHGFHNQSPSSWASRLPVPLPSQFWHNVRDLADMMIAEVQRALEHPDLVHQILLITPHSQT